MQKSPSRKFHRGHSLSRGHYSITSSARASSESGTLRPSALYQVPEIVTRRRFPGACESDSTWRTEEVRHGGSNPVARRLRCVSASRFGKEEQGWAAGSPAVGAGSDLRGGDTVRCGQNWRGWPSDHPRLGVALERAWS